MTRPTSDVAHTEVAEQHRYDAVVGGRTGEPHAPAVCASAAARRPRRAGAGQCRQRVPLAGPSCPHSSLAENRAAVKSRCRRPSDGRSAVTRHRRSAPTTRHRGDVGRRRRTGRRAAGAVSAHQAVGPPVTWTDRRSDRAASSTCVRDAPATTRATSRAACPPSTGERSDGEAGQPARHLPGTAPAAPSWHSTPIEPSVTRWISRYDGGRLSCRPSCVRRATAGRRSGPPRARSHARVNWNSLARTGSSIGVR